MNEQILARFWGECRQQLLAFRSLGFPDGTTPEQKLAKVQEVRARLDATARSLDPDRRTTNYNLPSILQPQMDAIMGKTEYLMTKWVNDGCPPSIPAV